MHGILHSLLLVGNYSHGSVQFDQLLNEEGSLHVQIQDGILAETK